MNFRPTQDYILVKPLEREHSTTIAVITHEKHCRGVILAVGPGKKDKKGRVKPLDAKVGDVIHFGDGTRTLDQCYPKIQDGNVTLRLIQEADIAYIEEHPLHTAALAMAASGTNALMLEKSAA